MKLGISWRVERRRYDRSVQREKEREVSGMCMSLGQKWHGTHMV